MSTIFPVVLGAAAAVDPGASAGSTASIEDLVRRIKDKDDAVRTAAWQEAGLLGAGAVNPLAALMHNPDPEVARAARRGLQRVVCHAGRPGADGERQAVSAALVELLRDEPIRREALWLLSLVAGANAIDEIARFLGDREFREDARAVLERIPVVEAVTALKSALRSAPDEFKLAVAHSLRVRGVEVAGYPEQKLVPTRPASDAVKTG